MAKKAEHVEAAALEVAAPVAPEEAAPATVPATEAGRVPVVREGGSILHNGRILAPGESVGNLPPAILEAMDKAGRVEWVSAQTQPGISA